MIPRKIHFVWLGSEVPELYLGLIRRCGELNPGWQVKVWREEEIGKLVRSMGTRLTPRLRQKNLTLSTKSDLARYHIIAQAGGIYLDTDFLVLRSFESLRKYSFFGVYQQPGLVCSGVFGAAHGQPVFESVFEHLRHADYGQSSELLAGPHMFSPICQAAVRRETTASILPPSSFLPVHYDEKRDVAVWLSRNLRNSYAVHLWAHSWGPGGGESQRELLGRIGATLLNHTCPGRPPPR